MGIYHHDETVVGDIKSVFSHEIDRAASKKRRERYIEKKEQHNELKKQTENQKQKIISNAHLTHETSSKHHDINETHGGHDIVRAMPLRKKKGQKIWGLKL